MPLNVLKSYLSFGNFKMEDSIQLRSLAGLLTTVPAKDKRASKETNPASAKGLFSHFLKKMMVLLTLREKKYLTIEMIQAGL
jgi:hypothetical protein